MNIEDVYSWKSSENRKNNPLLPNNIRGLIIGKSFSGKTNLLLNLLLKPDWLDYNNLFVFGNSLHQKEYQILRQGFEQGLSKRQISNIFSNQTMLKEQNISPLDIIKEYNGTKEGGIKAVFYENCNDIPDPKSIDSSLKNLLILDDCYLGKQNKAEAFWSRGRHNNIDSFYISQNYFRLPRHTIRENSNIIILFPQDSRNLDHIYADHATDITKAQFQTLCKTTWREPFNFVVIDLSSSRMSGKYRRNFDCFFLPDIEKNT